MTVLGIRFCHVAESATAEQMAEQLGEGLGIEQLEMQSPTPGFQGAVFPASDASWIEIWPAGEGMPAGTMLQLVVDDADAHAAEAKAKGLAVEGPVDAHGERIYFLTLAGGLRMSFQSREADAG
ncbi:hypothetical protein GCM10007989_17170 [Devosia pacifica]|uniref:VOC domain-containing protein n=1 Tax=Devosia pacifica TaxID=1335967 RepID=A0A918S4B4_9HYPH|nr:hypothetical protein [Devosia pacifica]GHA22343.1 hypothetical protein GCM10007989_17170 [Devosia pacifica]